MTWFTCARGHERTEESTSFDKKGYRVCLICKRENERRKRERNTWGKLKALAGDVTPCRPVEVRTASDVIAAVAYDFGLPAAALTLDLRHKPFMLARRTAAYVLVQRGNSTPRVGKWLGVDHSSVIHALKQFELCATDKMRVVAARYIPQAEALAA